MGNKWDSNEITREYFDSLLVEMRHIDSVIPSTRLELYGEVFDTPVMTAALSHLDKIHENGMVEMAKGAHAANAVNWAGMGDEGGTGGNYCCRGADNQDNQALCRQRLYLPQD